MKKQSLTKNFAFQFTYQILITAIPLVISPYLTRVIGDTGLGIYAYAYSIAYYFVLFAMLGILKYGQRLISENYRDEIGLRKAFWSLYAVHAFFSVLSILLYVAFVLLFVHDSRYIYFILTGYVASALFDITWLFYGLENFQSVVIRNTIIKVAECVLIFTLVKSSDDLWIYATIVSCGLALGQLVMIPQAIKIVKPIRFSREDVKKHIKPLFVLSIAVAAVSLYTVFDKTLLGLMTIKENVAYYEYASKIINIPKMVIGVIGTVTFPAACKMVERWDYVGHRKFVKTSMTLTCLIGFAAVFGLIAVADPLALLYYGKSFAKCGGIIKSLSPAIIIIGLGNNLRMQYLIPKKMDKSYTICICLNAVVNLILSISLIPLLGIYGAVIGTVAAETFGLLYQMWLCKEVISLKELVREIIPFSIIGLVMFVVVRVILSFWKQSWVSLIGVIVIGGALYILLACLYLRFFDRELYDKLFDKVKNMITGNAVMRMFRKKKATKAEKADK